jgi:cardiolipin synthase
VARFAEIGALIEGARRSITVISPYLTFPATDALAVAARRGVAVQLITPRDNNKRLVRDALLSEAAAAGFDLRLTPGMSHLKGLLVDDEALVVGSCNFDFVSLGAEEEIVAIVRDTELIAQFRERIVGPALAEALAPGAFTIDRKAGASAQWRLKFAAWVVSLTRGARRTAIDWR